MKYVKNCTFCVFCQRLPTQQTGSITEHFVIRCSHPMVGVNIENVFKPPCGGHSFITKEDTLAYTCKGLK